MDVQNLNKKQNRTGSHNLDSHMHRAHIYNIGTRTRRLVRTQSTQARVCKQAIEGVSLCNAMFRGIL